MIGYFPKTVKVRVKKAQNTDDFSNIFSMKLPELVEINCHFDFSVTTHSYDL